MRQLVLLFSFVLVLVLLWSAFDSPKVDYLILVNRNHFSMFQHFINRFTVKFHFSTVGRQTEF